MSLSYILSSTLCYVTPSSSLIDQFLSCHMQHLSGNCPFTERNFKHWYHLQCALLMPWLWNSVSWCI